MKKISANAKISAAVITITLIDLLLVLAFIFYGTSLVNIVHVEVFKLTYQFLLLVVIGGAITSLFTMYLRTREDEVKAKEKLDSKRREAKELQRRYYSEFAQAYNDSKKVRRLLRARARILRTDGLNNQAVMIKTSTYDELIKELNMVQLKVEFYFEQVLSFDQFNTSKSFSDSMEQIKLCLKGIITEYENCYLLFPDKSFIEEVDYVPLENLPKLREFIGKHKDSAEFQQYKTAYDRVLKDLLKQILEPEMNFHFSQT